MRLSGRIPEGLEADLTYSQDRRPGLFNEVSGVTLESLSQRIPVNCPRLWMPAESKLSVDGRRRDDLLLYFMQANLQ